MPSTPDWKKEAEKKHEQEEEDIRAEVKSGFYLHLFYLSTYRCGLRSNLCCPLDGCGR